ncbi:MAG: Eco47II family restriction endonuclease [Eubacteriales bacterium]
MEFNFYRAKKIFQIMSKQRLKKYGEKLEPFDLKRFNKNIIDPIKLIFDKTVYQSSWEEIVSNEIFRQRDKSNNNDIGYFHQRIFQHIKNCHVPPNVVKKAVGM